MESFKGLEVVIWGSITRCKVYAFVSCKVNFFPKLFHNLSLSFGGVQLQRCYGRLEGIHRHGHSCPFWWPRS